MIKYLLFAFAAVFISTFPASAQNFQFGEITLQDLDMKSYPADVNAHALVLNEYGRSFITDNGTHIQLMHEYHVRIKIFNSKGFKNGDIEVPLYKEDRENFEEISAIKGITFSIGVNQGIVQTELDPKKIFMVNQNKHYTLAKFAMPGLTDGSVIEYQYTITSPFFFNFKEWQFQSGIPKLHSVYKAEIPAVYNYNILLRGALKLTKSNAELHRDCFVVGRTKCDCSDLTYTIDNIPAFVEEDYMTAEKNFISAIYFELSDYTSLSSGLKVKVTKDWKDIDYSLKNSEFFGSQIKRASLMKERIAAIIAGKPDDLSKAEAIYTFVQKNIKWNSFYSKYSDDGIKKALDTHSGTIGDINLTLIAALNAAGINTDAVLLSTREHGLVNKLYPTESDFNYVIAKTTIGDKSYFLDASVPLLGFGTIPERCLNDQGRVLSMTKGSYWTDIKEPQKKSEISSLDLALQANGKLKGTYTRYSLGYEGYERRASIKKFNTENEYVEDLDEKMPRLKIINYAITNLDTLDKPVAEKYDIEVSGTDNTNKERIAFSPFILGHRTVNPFKLAERTYPVDMGMPSEERYTVTLHIPDGYEVETLPQNIGLTMPNGAGLLVSNFQNNDGVIVYSEALKFSKAVYNVDEYPYLKELYNKVILAEKAEIVLKKKAK